MITDENQTRAQILGVGYIKHPHTFEGGVMACTNIHPLFKENILINQLNI